MAVVHSKFVSMDKLLAGFDCNDFYHPWTPNCLVGMLGIAKSCTIGSVRFAASLFMLQLIFNARKADRKYVQNSAKNYMRMVLVLSCMAPLAGIIGCFFKKLFGKFHHFTVVFLPAVLAIFIPLYQIGLKKRELYSLAFFTFVMEYSVRCLIRAGKLELTKPKKCISFMILSAAAMYLMRCNREVTRGITYWFFSPPAVQKPKDGNDNTKTKRECYHEESCWKHAAKDARKYLAFGLAVGMLRPLQSMFRKVFRSPADVFKQLCSLKNVSLGVFFGSYVALYHAVSCLLFRYRLCDSESHALVAGFVAGVAFWFHPNLTILMMMVTAGVQELMKRGLAQGIVPRSKLLFIVIFAVLTGALIHSHIVDGELCHPFVRRMLNEIAGGHDVRLSSTICSRQQELYFKR
ncbi:transmembrane protein 135-like [Periplaneta americana]|uniref:transmembrane protein 135-like n=1 Tax=Periplaneta americana TaxID=6978 RepID=UPI0037E7B0F2